MLEAIHILVAASVVLTVPGEGGTNGAARRFHARIGSCNVTAVSPLRPDRMETSADGSTGLRSTAFLVHLGAKTVLVAPISLTRQDRTSHVVPDAVILTSLGEEQLRGVMDGDRPAFPDSPVFVDRALVDGALEPGSAGTAARSVLAVYQAIGRLRITEPDAQAMPGVTITISPDRQRSESRVRIACGSTTLMLLPGREMAFTSTPAVGRRADDLPRMLASDGYAVAVTDGRYPGIGRVYAEHDGYHCGSVEARSLGGVPRRRGEVIVEVSDESPHAAASTTARTEHAAAMCAALTPCEGQSAGAAVSPR